MKGKAFAQFLLSFILFLAVFLPASVFAGTGPGGPGTGGGDPACDPKCNCRADGSYCPIDSNLYILLAIGVLYGIKKVTDSKKAATR
jgi:hypothetical protein